MDDLYQTYKSTLPEGDKIKPRSFFKTRAALTRAIEANESKGKLTHSLSKAQRARLRRYCRSNNIAHPHGSRWSSHRLPVEALKLVST